MTKERRLTNLTRPRYKEADIFLGKLKDSIFLSRDRYKALYFNLLKTIRLAAIGCDDKDGEAGRD